MAVPESQTRVRDRWVVDQAIAKLLMPTIERRSLGQPLASNEFFDADNLVRAMELIEKSHHARIKCRHHKRCCGDKLVFLFGAYPKTPSLWHAPDDNITSTGDVYT